MRTPQDLADVECRAARLERLLLRQPELAMLWRMTREHYLVVQSDDFNHHKLPSRLRRDRYKDVIAECGVDGEVKAKVGDPPVLGVPITVGPGTA